MIGVDPANETSFHYPIWLQQAFQHYPTSCVEFQTRREQLKPFSNQLHLKFQFHGQLLPHSLLCMAD